MTFETSRRFIQEAYRTMKGYHSQPHTSAGDSDQLKNSLDELDDVQEEDVQDNPLQCEERDEERIDKQQNKQYAAEMTEEHCVPSTDTAACAPKPLENISFDERARLCKLLLEKILKDAYAAVEQQHQENKVYEQKYAVAGLRVMERGIFFPSGREYIPMQADEMPAHIYQLLGRIIQYSAMPNESRILGRRVNTVEYLERLLYNMDDSGNLSKRKLLEKSDVPLARRIIREAL